MTDSIIGRLFTRARQLVHPGSDTIGDHELHYSEVQLRERRLHPDQVPSDELTPVTQVAPRLSQVHGER